MCLHIFTSFFLGYPMFSAQPEVPTTQGHPCEEPTEDIHHQRQGGSLGPTKRQGHTVKRLKARGPGLGFA